MGTFIVLLCIYIYSLYKVYIKKIVLILGIKFWSDWLPFQRLPYWFFVCGCRFTALGQA